MLLGHLLEKSKSQKASGPVYTAKQLIPRTDPNILAPSTPINWSQFSRQIIIIQHCTMKSAITLLLLVMVPLFAFTQALEGKILGEKKSPIVGAYIINVSTQEHTHSNDGGTFLLKNYALGDTLQVIHLGYKTHTEILSATDSPITIELEESIFQLDEVVVGRSDRSLNLLSGIDLTLNPVNSSQWMVARRWSSNPARASSQLPVSIPIRHRYRRAA